jgi:shikimate dehydrogenase
MSAMPPIVDGRTRLYGIIGHPIEQVGSPAAFSARFRAAGWNAILLPFDVRPEAFDATVRGLMALGNLDGLIATIPYKFRMPAFMDEVLPTGRIVGAINTMKRAADGRWIGDMFDGRGFIAALARQGHSVKDRRALLLGAGGAGSAVGCAIAEAGAAALTIVDQAPAKAAELATRIRNAFPQCHTQVGAPDPAGADLIVNATPVGMAPEDGLPVALPPLDPATIVFDIIVKDEPTPLQRFARDCGCPILGGRMMLEGQVETMARFFGAPI